MEPARSSSLHDSDTVQPVRVLSLNCWGLKGLAKVRKERIATIARRLAAAPDDYDVIALQEVWVDEDAELLKKSIGAALPYSKRFYSGIIAGPGLMTFSRWPIEQAWIHRFPLNGRPSAFFRGDWYVGKAVGCCVISHPSGAQIQILNAHLHAPYGPGDAAYTCHRTAQAWDMARIAHRATAARCITIAVGDLNSRPGSLTHQLFERVGGLSDAWPSLHGELDVDMATLTPQEQIDVAGVTSDSQLNSWRAHYPLHRAQRLDYIFFDASMARVTDCKVQFTEPEPGVGSVSDHFGISAAFSITALAPSSLTGRSSIPTTHQYTLDVEMYDGILKVINDYRPTARWQVYWRTSHFVVSVLVIIGLLIGSWWAAANGRAYVCFIFVLATFVLSFTGLAQGLMGLLFGGTEHRALREFEDEISLARHRVVERMGHGLTMYGSTEHRTSHESQGKI